MVRVFIFSTFFIFALQGVLPLVHATEHPAFLRLTSKQKEQIRQGETLSFEDRIEGNPWPSLTVFKKISQNALHVATALGTFEKHSDLIAEVEKAETHLPALPEPEKKVDYQIAPGDLQFRIPFSLFIQFRKTQKETGSYVASFRMPETKQFQLLGKIQGRLSISPFSDGENNKESLIIFELIASPSIPLRLAVSAQDFGKGTITAVKRIAESIEKIDFDEWKNEEGDFTQQLEWVDIVLQENATDPFKTLRELDPFVVAYALIAAQEETLRALITYIQSDPDALIFVEEAKNEILEELEEIYTDRLSQDLKNFASYAGIGGGSLSLSSVFRKYPIQSLGSFRSGPPASLGLSALGTFSIGWESIQGLKLPFQKNHELKGLQSQLFEKIDPSFNRWIPLQKIFDLTPEDYQRLCDRLKENESFDLEVGIQAVFELRDIQGRAIIPSSQQRAWDQIAESFHLYEPVYDTGLILPNVVNLDLHIQLIQKIKTKLQSLTDETQDINRAKRIKKSLRQVDQALERIRLLLTS